MAAGDGETTGKESRVRAVFRARTALMLTTLVALLSVVTGILNIVEATTVSGPLAPYVPDLLRQTVGFTGTLTGFLMLVSAAGLRRGLRAAWYSTLVLLPVTALQGVAQANLVSIPLVVLSVLTIPLLLWNRRVFDRRLDLTATQLAAFAAIVGAQVYGTVGTWVLQEEFTNVETLTDAFYYTLITASTVGYGDVTPAPGSQRATLFAMSVVIVGTASFAVALGTFLTPAIEARLANALGHMSQSELDLLENHLIVLGVGELTEPILEEIAESGEPFVVIAADPERAQRLRERGYEVVTADPTEDEPLRRVGIGRARALVAATNDDAQDALAILAARELAPGLHIVAAATERENAKKLKRAGASEVLSPTAIGGHLVVQSALGMSGMEAFADRILQVEASEEGSAEVDVEEDSTEVDVEEDSGETDGSGGSTD